MKIDYITIFTDKLEESIAFYTGTLGFTVTDRVESAGSATLVFMKDDAGRSFELVHTGEKLPAVSHSPVALTVTVPCIVAAEKKVDTLGHEKTLGPLTLPNGISLMHISDPNGVIVNFVQLEQ